MLLLSLTSACCLLAILLLLLFLFVSSLLLFSPCWRYSCSISCVCYQFWPLFSSSFLSSSYSFPLSSPLPPTSIIHFCFGSSSSYLYFPVVLVSVVIVLDLRFVPLLLAPPPPGFFSSLFSLLTLLNFLLIPVFLVNIPDSRFLPPSYVPPPLSPSASASASFCTSSLSCFNVCILLVLIYLCCYCSWHSLSSYYYSFSSCSSSSSSFFFVASVFLFSLSWCYLSFSLCFCCY